MMLLLRLRFWLLILLLALLWGYRVELQQWILPLLEEQPPLEARFAEEVRQVVGYELKREEWLPFPLNQNGPVVRVLTNAVVPLNAPSLDTNEWDYSLLYRLLDGNGAIIHEGEYQHHTRLTRFQLSTQGPYFTPAMFRLGERTLADTRIFPLNIKGQEPPLTLWLKLKAQEPIIEQVVARVFREELVQAEKASLLWNRLSPESRDQIAKSTLYPGDLLTERERSALMGDLWRPQGPRGVPGEDFQAVPFLVWEDAIEERFFVSGRPVPPQGFPFGAGRYGVIPVPEQGGRLRLELKPERALARAEVPVSIAWFGRLAVEHEQFQRRWRGKALSLTLKRGGTLVLSAPEAFVLRAYLRTPTGEQEITPEPSLSPAWDMGGDQALVFPLHLPSGRRAPYRAKVRMLAPAHSPLWQQAQRFEWRFFDAHDHSLDQGRVQFRPRISAFDRLRGGAADQWRVSEPHELVLHAPPGSRRLEFTAAAPLWVSLANRPADMPRRLRLPEDAYPQAERLAQPLWFLLRPLRWREHQKAGRFQLITQQRRPPESLEQERGWISLEPEEARDQRFLLVPRHPAAPPLHPLISGAGYQNLPVDQTHAVRWVTAPGRTEVSPRLIYQRRHGRGDTPLRLYLDGALYLSTRLAGVSGEVSLPPISASQHSIRIETEEPLRLFLSHTERPTHLKRLAVRIRPGDRLHYPVTTEPMEPKTLSARLYAFADNGRRSVLTSELLAPRRLTRTQLPDWTIQQRRYDLREAGGPRSLVIGSGGLEVDRGQPFFIPLGGDLQGGEQRLRITLREGPGGYLILGEAPEGLEERRQLSIEEYHSDD